MEKIIMRFRIPKFLNFTFSTLFCLKIMFDQKTIEEFGEDNENFIIYVIRWRLDSREFFDFLVNIFYH